MQYDTLNLLLIPYIPLIYPLLEAYLTLACFRVAFFCRGGEGWGA